MFLCYFLYNSYVKFMRLLRFDRAGLVVNAWPGGIEGQGRSRGERPK